MNVVTANRACAILHDLLRSRGDRRPFLLPANVCPIVPVTFREAGQPFELVDIAEPDLEIDITACARLLAASPGRYGGMLFVRPYGSEADRDDVFRELRRLQPDLFLLDDKCLCPPDPSGSRVSACVDATLFSTGPRKHLDLGGGGFAYLAAGVECQRGAGPHFPAALEQVEARYRRAIAERQPFGAPPPGWLDLRPPARTWVELRAAIAAALPAATAHKRELNAIYAGELPSEVQLARPLQSWRFNVRVPAADRLVADLFAAGLFASRHYAPLGGVFGDGDFPVAARLHAEVVNLFNDGAFDTTQARRAAAVVRRHLAIHGAGDPDRNRIPH